MREVMLGVLGLLSAEDIRFPPQGSGELRHGVPNHHNEIALECGSDKRRRVNKIAHADIARIEMKRNVVAELKINPPKLDVCHTASPSSKGCRLKTCVLQVYRKSFSRMSTGERTSAMLTEIY